MSDLWGQTAGPLTRRVADAYSTEAEGYSTHWSPVIRPFAQPLLEAMPWEGARLVIDVATGSGALVPDIQRLAPRARVVGVDPSVGMLQVARRATSISLMRGDAMRLGVRDGCADVLLLAFMLFHLPDPVAALAEARRVLREGGAVGTVTWGDYPVAPAVQVWDEELTAHGAEQDQGFLPGQEKLMDTPEKMSGLLESAGLHAVRCWVKRFEHQWDPAHLEAVRTGFGISSRRLRSIPVEARQSCIARARERVARLEPEGLLFRPEVVYAIGSRSSPPLRVRKPGHIPG